MASYTVRFFEDGETSKSTGLAQLPETFTASDLGEYLEGVTGRKEKLTFYVNDRLFTQDLKYMASVSNSTAEDTIGIEYYFFDDDLQPDYKIEIPGNVSCFKLSTDGKQLFVTTSDKRFFLCALEEREVVFVCATSDIVLQIAVDKGQVFGLTAANKIVDLYEDTVVYEGLSIPITSFMRNGTFVVGFDDGRVEVQGECVLSLESQVMFVGRDSGLLVVVAELGKVVRHDLERGVSVTIDLRTDVTACCYFGGSVYIATTQGEIVVVDAALQTRTLSTTFYYIDWIFANRKVCATSNHKTLLTQKNGTGIPKASAHHDNQLVFVDGNEYVLVTGFNNCIYVFLTTSM